MTRARHSFFIPDVHHPRHVTHTQSLVLLHPQHRLSPSVLSHTLALAPTLAHDFSVNTDSFTLTCICTFTLVHLSTLTPIFTLVPIFTHIHRPGGLADELINSPEIHRRGPPMSPQHQGPITSQQPSGSGDNGAADTAIVDQKFAALVQVPLPAQYHCVGIMRREGLPGPCALHA